MSYLIMTVKVTANGQDAEATVPCTLEEFLRSRGLHPRSVVVELNGLAISPSNFTSRELRDGDRLEIVKIIAGG